MTTTTKDKAAAAARAKLKLAAANAGAVLALAQDQTAPLPQWQFALGRAGRWLTAVHLDRTNLNDEAYSHVTQAAVLCALGAGEDHMATLHEVEGYGPASLSREGLFARNGLRAILRDPNASVRGQAHAKVALAALKAACAAKGVVLG